MSTTTLIITILLALGAGAIVFLPLLEGGSNSSRRHGPRGRQWQEQALETLDAEKGRVLRAVRDLDFDYDLGKLPGATYAAQRIHLLRRGAAILGRIMEIETEIAEEEARLEEAIATFRGEARAR